MDQDDQPEIRPLPEPPRCRGIALGDGNFTGCAYGYGDLAPFTGPRDCPICNGSGIDRKILLLLLLPLLALASSDSHRTHRSTVARREFKHEHPCPATGQATGPCPGYVIDHITALACGGKDAPDNMQWQTKEAAHEKDRIERLDCGG